MNPIDLANLANNLTGVGTGNANKMHQMQVDDVELRLMLADVYAELNMKPRENLRECAEHLMMHINMEQAYAMAQQKFYDRQYAYSNGSVLERFRRFIGGHPSPPMHPYQAMQMGHQVIPMPTPYLPQGMPMANTQPMGFNQGQPMQQAPQPTSGDARIEQLEAQMNQMNQALSQITQFIGSQGQGGN